MVKDFVEEKIEDYNDNDMGLVWQYEDRIPDEINGWIYYGDGGVLAIMENFLNEDKSKAVAVMERPTHPHDDNKTDYQVYYVKDMDNKIESKEVIDTYKGEKYRTPLYVTRLLYWKAVNRAIEFMEENSPEDI